MTDEAVAHLKSVDQTLAELIRRAGPCTLRPKRRRSPFEALVQSVVYQQLNGRAAATILGRVKALYPRRRFPRPEDLLATPEAQLRAAGLSRAKTASVRDIAAKTLAGLVPTSRAIEHLTNEEIVERLTELRGVGRWTAEMILIFTLGRPDVLPATDYGVRRGFSIAYGRAELPSPRELLHYGEPWRPYRTTAAWYLWRACELPVKVQRRLTQPEAAVR